MPHEPAWHAEKNYRPPFAPNLLGQILRAHDTLYNEEPSRATDPEGEQEWAERAVWRFGLGMSVAMSRVDTLTRLHGTALLYPGYKTSASAARDLLRALDGTEESVDPDADGVEFLALGRWMFEILPSEFDPRAADAVVVLMGRKTVAGGHGLAREVEVHHYWDADKFAILENWSAIEIGPNGEKFIDHGMGEIPCVICRNTEGDLETYADGFGGDDLRENLLAVASHWREYGWTAKLQRGQPWANGEVKDAVLAPDAIIKVPEGSTFNITSNGANLVGIRACVIDHAETMERALGVAPGTISIVASSSAQSGVAIALNHSAMKQERERRTKFAAMWEREGYRKACKLYGAVRGVDHAGVMSVQFRPLPMVVSFSERLDRLRFLASEGWIHPADALRELYPGATSDEIEQRLERAAEWRSLTEPTQPQ